MAKAKNNLAIWDQVSKTDPKITKGADLGRMKITAISPQHQRKAATELFGPIGIGWGVVNEIYDYMDIGDTKLCTYRATFWYVWGGERGEFPIAANVKVAYQTRNGYLTVDDEYAKKVATNALTKGLSTLGFNSDVFEGKFDDCKYVQDMAAEFEAKQRVVPKADKPDSLDTYKSLLEVAARDGGLNAFRDVWVNTQKVAQDEVKKCQAYIKSSPSEQEWLQEQKLIAQATDEREGITA